MNGRNGKIKRKKKNKKTKLPYGFKLCGSFY